MTASLAHELIPAPTSVDVFLRLKNLPYCVFLDSAMTHDSLGRYSFVAADPFDTIVASDDAPDPLGKLQSHIGELDEPNIDGLPPFQGGAAGLLGYDLNRTLEQLPSSPSADFDIPTLIFGLYDVVIAWDHMQGRAWLISTGRPAENPKDKQNRAADRLATFRRLLEEPVIASDTPPHHSPDNRDAVPLLHSGRTSYPIDGYPGLYSDQSQSQYLEMIRQGVEYVLAGDIFQVNLAHRLLHAATSDSTSLYLRLRERNAAPFAAYFDTGEFQILSASPERLVRVAERRVETRPIKGTCPITNMPEADLFAAQQLLESKKDRAENVMIVDLLRNDLSRVCDPDSVRVTQLCELEKYQYVQHLVSAVEGRLADSVDVFDLLRSVFPGGSITGAPKIRAMEIISALEQSRRGAYCGSFGYIGFNGHSDMNILIRTITACDGWWQIPVGGGIVADSIAESEYEETITKARGMVRALE